MPHITKFQEKRQCVKTSRDDWSIDKKQMYKSAADICVRGLSIPDSFYKAIAAMPPKYSDYTQENKATLFNIISDVIDDVLKPTSSSEWFNEFVEVKKLDDYISF